MSVCQVCAELILVLNQTFCFYIHTADDVKGFQSEGVAMVTVVWPDWLEIPRRSFPARVYPAAASAPCVRGRAGVAEPHRAGPQHPVGSVHVCEEQHRRGDQTHHGQGLQEPTVGAAAVAGRSAAHLRLSVLRYFKKTLLEKGTCVLWQNTS